MIFGGERADAVADDLSVKTEAAGELEQQAVLSGKFAKSGAKRLSSVKQTNHFSAATSAGVSGTGVDGIAVEEPGSGKGD